MNRISLLTAQVKAEVWARMIINKHEKKFASLMEGMNVPNPTQTPEAQVPGGNAVNQPAQFPVAGQPQRGLPPAGQ